MTHINSIGNARQPGQQRCPHVPRCPGGLAHDRGGARTIASHPEQGWILLCNGVVVFDAGGELLPGGRAVPSPPPPANDGLPAAA
jgi:hypothetical protein